MRLEEGAGGVGAGYHLGSGPVRLSQLTLSPRVCNKGKRIISCSYGLDVYFRPNPYAEPPPPALLNVTSHANRRSPAHGKLRVALCKDRGPHVP